MGINAPVPNPWRLTPDTSPPPKGALGAARVYDAHECVHAGGPVHKGSRTVDVNGLPFARTGDPAKCLGGDDYIVTGSATVLVNGKHAARMSSKTMHAGKVTEGSPNVFVGGPDAGGTVGHEAEGVVACKELSQTRQHAPGTTNPEMQSWSNCGIEASRLLLHQGAASTISEIGLARQAITGGNAATLGGTTPEQQVAILNGTPGLGGAALSPQTPEGIVQAVADGRGVISGHIAGQLWGKPASGSHAVSPTAVDFNSNGDITHVHVVDSGTGKCDESIQAVRYFDSTSPWPNGVQTTRRIW